MSKFVVHGVKVNSGGTLISNTMDSCVELPKSLLTEAVSTASSEIHGIKVEGRAKFKNFKSTVSVKDKDGKVEDEVYEDNLFTNAWNGLKQTSDLPMYELKGKCGVLIICNTFKGNKKLFRVGAEDDIEAMEELFEALNCDVLTKENVYEGDLERILKRFKSRLIKEGYGSSIVIIMSHGGRSANSIVMEDGKEKNLYRDFVYQFSHNKFPEFVGKPKIFLVQACQDYGDVELRDLVHNDDDESQMHTDSNSTVSNKLEKVSIQDVLVSFATTPYQTARRTNKGSFFIQAIKEVFQKSAKDGRTLRAMLYDVHQNVTKTCEKYNEEQSVTSFESAFKNYVFKRRN